MTGFRCEMLAKHHDRTEFRCGVAALDNWLARTARQDHERSAATVYVFVPTDQPQRIAGFYTLSSAAIALSEFPADYTRKLPKYQLIPATLLGRLARDLDFPGLGRLLLADALQRAWTQSSVIASIAIVVDAKDRAAFDFYRRHQFQPLQQTPSRLFLPLSIVPRIRT